MRIYMQTMATPDQAPKFCHLHLEPDLFEGWMLTKEWGFQGEKGRNLRKHYNDVDEAEAALEKMRNLQLKRGFRVVFIEGQINAKG